MQLTQEEVREIRKRLGWTLAETAERLGGLHKDTVRDWERGRRPCRGPAAILLKQFGHVPIIFKRGAERKDQAK